MRNDSAAPLPRDGRGNAPNVRRASAHRLLDAPILPTIFRLATPGFVLALFQTAVSIADTFFVGRLGTEALAGLALVFPLLMLLQMMSAGAMGGGVSSALARALGAGNDERARNLVAHAVVIALTAGAGFTVLLLALGRPLYALLGGAGGTLAQALAYSNLLFTGAVFVWIANTLASVLRGSGNTFVPAVALAGAALVQIPLSGALTLGWAGFPRLGIAGAAIAYVVAFACAAVAMGWYLRGSPLWPTRADYALRWPQFREILRVGALSSLGAVQTIVTAIVLTGLVGSFGAAALAGYGIGVRLELLLVPIVFAIGQALVVLVGVHVGSGRHARAKTIAWTGAAVAMAISCAVGGFVAIFPTAWVGLFSSDPAVIAASSRYLRIVAPFYPLFGAAMALYFASQGSGYMLLPILSGTARLLFVVVGGLIVVAAGGGLGSLFAVIAGGLALFGTLMGLAVHRLPWGR